MELAGTCMVLEDCFGTVWILMDPHGTLFCLKLYGKLLVIMKPSEPWVHLYKLIRVYRLLQNNVPFFT